MLGSLLLSGRQAGLGSLMELSLLRPPACAPRGSAAAAARLSLSLLSAAPAAHKVSGRITTEACS